jgi:hypothetical protein
LLQKGEGDFDTYFFVIDNFVKHANAKGYNRHVATGAMQLSELLYGHAPPQSLFHERIRETLDFAH